MAAENGEKIKFQIELIASDDTIYDDIQLVTFIRMPIVKQASFCVVQLPISVITLKQIESLLASNIRDIWKMRIFSIDEASEDEDDQYDCIFDKFFQIMSVQPQEIVDFTKENVVVKLLLVNPILYSLETTTSFNRVIVNVTAYDAIENYEQFLDENYGQFRFNHVGTTELKNTYKYEQIFIPSSVNTINVPKYIINTYKPFHSYSIYFFDDFYFSDDSDKEITGHLLNLGDVYNQFKEYDINEYMDVVNLTKKLTTKEFTDPFRLLDRDAFTSIIFRTKDAVGGLLKKMSSMLPQLTVANLETDKKLDKEIKVPKSQISNAPQRQSARASIVYVPDTEKNAKKRLETAKDLMFNKFERMVIYETENCLPFWLQFGYLYNMEMDDPDEYRYTPLGIVNLFRRAEMKDDNLKMIHSCKYIMLKVIPEKDDYQAKYIRDVAI